MVGVVSETGVLKKVLMHRPDAGIDRLTPQIAESLLYDDIVWLEAMQLEHDLLTQCVQAVCSSGAVVDFEDLLAQAIANCADPETALTGLVEQAGKYPPEELSRMLITGVNAQGNGILPPLPNLIFCRDVAAVVGKLVILSYAAKNARKRESSLMKFIVSHHPLFFDFTVIDINPDHAYDVTLEGGDVLLTGEGELTIGISERTNRKAVERLLPLLWAQGSVRRVVVADMPKERYCMHLDTVITALDETHWVGYRPLIEERMPVTVYGISGTEETYPHLAAYWKQQYPHRVLIPCGGGQSPADAREQWTDGCNVFALRPGVAVAYDRNIQTAKAIAAHGYRLIRAEEVISKGIAEGQKVLILIPSYELSRARGGPHCLTLPLHRA